MELGLPDEIQDMGHTRSKKTMVCLSEIQSSLGSLYFHLLKLVTLTASKNFRSRRNFKEHPENWLIL